MINYKRCAEVSMDQVFEAFSLGYSDYILPVKIDQETFVSRFFGPEGNDTRHSFIALDDGKPAGLVLGGIRTFDGLKTLRCGTLCTAPSHRGQGVGQKLFDLHMAVAEQEGCAQKMLEVITTNANAIRLYEKCGYRVGHTLRYYTWNNPLPPEGEPALPVEAAGFDALQDYRQALPGLHVNWQSDLPTLARMADAITVFTARDGDRAAALCAITQMGRLAFLHVQPEYRGRGLATHLVRHAAQAQGVERVSAAFADNALAEGFLRKTGFEKEALEQFEMYLPCGLAQGR